MLKVVMRMCICVLAHSDRYVPLYVGLTVLASANVYIIWLVNRRNKQWQGTFNPKIEQEKKFMKSIVQPLK